MILVPHEKINLLLAAFLSMVLSSCGGDKGDDLDQFMAEAAKGMTKEVDPLPEVLPYLPLEYNADGFLHDPFQPRKATNKSSSLQPNTSRPRELLESFPLESLRYVGSMSKRKRKYALIKDPDGVIQQVKVGNYLGPNFGLITSIDEAAIQIKEIVQDDLSGDWVERDASINLQEQG